MCSLYLYVCTSHPEFLLVSADFMPSTLMKQSCDCHVTFVICAYMSVLCKRRVSPPPPHTHTHTHTHGPCRVSFLQTWTLPDWPALTPPRPTHLQQTSTPDWLFCVDILVLCHVLFDLTVTKQKLLLIVMVASVLHVALFVMHEACIHN